MRYSSASIVRVSAKSARNGRWLRDVHWLGLVFALVAGGGSSGCEDKETTPTPPTPPPKTTPSIFDEVCEDSSNPSAECQAECPTIALCNIMCDCYGCSDDEMEKCVDENTNLKTYAEKEGCHEMVTDFLGCKLDKVHCNDTAVSFGDCSEKEQRLENCVKDDVELWVPGTDENSSSSDSASSSSASSGAGGSGGAAEF